MSSELDLYGELLTLTTTEADITQKMAALAPLFGCDRILFGIELRPPLMPVIQHITSCYPEEYQLLYYRKGFIANDPSVVHCQHKTDPILWTEKMYDDRSYELMEESGKYGLRYGMSIPVRESSKVVSMLSLGRDKPFTEAEYQNIVKRAAVAAASLHVATQKIVVPQLIDERRPNLSPREIECMKWVAMGKSNTMIADILKISDDTVKYHIGIALKKLNVATRAQAVYWCIALGLIT